MATREEKLRQWQESKRRLSARTAQSRAALSGKENPPFYPEASQRKTRSMTATAAAEDKIAMPPPSKPVSAPKPLSERNERELKAEADLPAPAKAEDDDEPWRLNSVRGSSIKETGLSTPTQKTQASLQSSGFSPIPMMMPNPDMSASSTPLRSNMHSTMSGFGMTPIDNWGNSVSRGIPGMGRESLGGNALSKLRARVDIMRRTSNMGAHMPTPMAASGSQLGKLDETGRPGIDKKLTSLLLAIHTCCFYLLRELARVGNIDRLDSPV